ncbi:formate dehydrogenase-N subunit alpha [Zophobihabitans entericus]|uniref:Formate dehydrogenase-N subunit alpha n=1 Tax=Zophobihabitans entericus TaxID=1635327 RepID=A0A6G9IDJ0_9GAMM|nr:formate dehydrogenase-N subunit alpha [Zophobihabitans entericus]QIQ22293.1 formate dehydrogenase-N subunit alpha [Zophobihabitans entericus]
MLFNRRQFFKICAGGMAGTTVATLGLAPNVALAQTRQYKLLKSKETRNNCTYCSVGCGLLLYSRGDGALNNRLSIFHVEGDPDHPVSRGSLCPKGAGVLDYIKSENRVQFPEYRAPGSDKWQKISWDDAIDRIARLMKEDRDKNFIEKNAQGTTVNRWTTTGWLVTSAASNETGWLAFKVARALGMLSLETQARVCHGPSVSSLAATYGRGAMTNNWNDIKNANVVIVMGGNAAEAHPVGFKWAIEAKINNGAELIAVDPRFHRTAAVADLYVPIRAGSDIAFLLGVINYLITNDEVNHEYLVTHSNASLLVRDDYDFNVEDGLFSGYNAEKRQYDQSSWTYQTDANGYALRDATLQHPRSVWQLLKQHVSRYTPEVVNNITGTPVDNFLHVCRSLASTKTNDRAATFLYALGWTQHSYGTQIIRTAAMIQLILGNIGVMGGGINALRGHSNIQGLTDVGLLSNRLPAYLDLPKDSQITLEQYLAEKTPKPFGPTEVNFWANYPKFFVSFMKSMYGDKATKENNWGFDWLPKWDKTYDVLQFSKMMRDGDANGFICQGFNPLAAFPDKNSVRDGLSKLKFLINIDPMPTETAEFWKNHGESNDVDSSKIQTEVFRLPSNCFAEEDGTIVNSSRWLQWHWAAAKPPFEAKYDPEIISRIFLRMKELYAEEGGPGQEPMNSLVWDYKESHEPSAEELAKDYNGRALADLKDANGNVTIKKGQLLSGFGQLKDDGTTSCGIWIFCGCWTEAGNQMARRDPSDPSGKGIHAGWAWAWPMNRRVLYNRASADANGKPWDPNRVLIKWDGSSWTGNDIPDFTATLPPSSGAGAFIMNNDGLGGLFCLNRLVDGPFPEHYEPFETPISTNPLHPKQISSPAARVFPEDLARLGTAENFPYVATTYSITEHFHFWTQHARINAITQPEQFIEMSENLANKKGIKLGDTVKVSSNRGYVKAKAVVTKRLPTLMVNGKEVETIGVPIVWGFTGQTKKGFLTNGLTPHLGDANSQTPEYKSFLVNIEKISA